MPTSAFEAWCYFHNRLADHAARVAHEMRPHRFWKLHSAFVTASQAALKISCHAHAVQIAVSRAVVQHQVALDAEGITAVLPVVSVATSPNEPCWTAEPEVDWVSQSTCHKFSRRLVVQTAALFLQGLIDCMVVQMLLVGFPFINYTVITCFVLVREARCTFKFGKTL